MSTTSHRYILKLVPLITSSDSLHLLVINLHLCQEQLVSVGGDIWAGDKYAYFQGPGQHSEQLTTSARSSLAVFHIARGMLGADFDPTMFQDDSGIFPYGRLTIL